MTTIIAKRVNLLWSWQRLVLELASGTSRSLDKFKIWANKTAPDVLVSQNTCSISNPAVWDSIYETSGLVHESRYLINGAKKRQTWKQKGQWYSCTRIQKIESMFSSSFNRFRRLKNDIQCALNWKFYWKLWQKLTNPAKKVREDLLNNPVFRAKSSHPLSPGDRKWSTRRQYRPHLKARFVRPWWSGVIFWALPSTLPLTESTLHSHTKRKRSVVGKGSILRWLVVFDQHRVFF